jgi:hypothetical protein
MNYSKDYLIAAHKHSSLHTDEILQSELCGCFYCTAIFTPGEIKDWVDEENPLGTTALCAKCGIDSVLGSASGLPVNYKEFLLQMKKYWF